MRDGGERHIHYKYIRNTVLLLHNINVSFNTVHLIDRMFNSWYIYLELKMFISEIIDFNIYGIFQFMDVENEYFYIPLKIG